MAGLIRRNASNISTAMPEFPTQDTSTWPYYSADQPEGYYLVRKGFAGGTAGRSIRTLLNATTSFSATLYNIDGTASTDGVWNGGMTIAEGAGSANADQFISAYMDTTDEVWYMLFADTSTSPDTWYFSKVNEAGTVTAIGNAQVGNASFDSQSYYGSYMGTLRRLGGDGSGNFGIYFTGTAGGNAAAAAPYRGCDITINATNGSLSYANMMPSTYGSVYPLMDNPYFGPSDNNIVGTVYGHWGGSGDNRPNSSTFGALANLTNGKGLRNVNTGGPTINNAPWGNGYRMIVERAATTYTCAQYYGTQYAPSIFNVDEVHAWLDEMAVYYGIL
jgi:hypothetical protein|tara:strand:+ start:279 stop:1274 length:996 start_codon:yes stop_codon:yes gene_type:complete